jgi:hypothetical protein
MEAGCRGGCPIERSAPQRAALRAIRVRTSDLLPGFGDSRRGSSSARGVHVDAVGHELELDLGQYFWSGRARAPWLEHALGDTYELNGTLVLRVPATPWPGQLPEAATAPWSTYFQVMLESALLVQTGSMEMALLSAAT